MRLSQAIKAGQQEKANGEAVTQDINTILKLSSRLQDMINYNKTLKEENDTFKVVSDCDDSYLILFAIMINDIDWSWYDDDVGTFDFIHQDNL